MRRLLVVCLGATAAAVAVLGVANAIVLGAARGDVVDVADAPRAEVALVLGAQVYRDGRLSAMLEDRIQTAAALYRAGRVRKVLLSGDHGRVGYDEVGAMRKRLLALGVPAPDVFTDHAGFDTWDSAQRARKVFAVRSALVVTQRYHLPRALYAARRAGLQATGVIADRRGYGRVMKRLELREDVARVKVLGDTITHASARFLGPVIPVTGDGRASWGP
jgi:SanA protein